MLAVLSRAAGRGAPLRRCATLTLGLMLVMLWPAACAGAAGLTLAPPSFPPSASPEQLLSYFNYPATAATFSLRLLETKEHCLAYSVTWESWVHSDYPVNNQVPAFYYQPQRSGKVPAIVVLHAYGTRRAEEEQQLCAYLAERGIACILPFLPYHYMRTPVGHESGALMVGADIDRTVQAVAQAMIDIRTAVDFLQQRPEVDGRRIGIVGISLGGILVHLAMGLEKRFVAGVSVLGGAEVADIMWTSPIMTPVRGKLERQQVALPELRQRLRIVEPLTYAGLNRPRHVLMIEGRYDLVVPPYAATAMWRALGEPEIIWLNTGHYGAVLVSHQLHALVAAYLLNQFGERRGPLPEVHAYTLKAGVIVDDRAGLSATFNVTLVHVGRNGFVDLALTTSGPIVGVSIRLTQVTELGIGAPIGKSLEEVRPYLAFLVVL